ncbi:MAG: HesA/MoeB/ThiF family protein [Nitrospinae bacterium]|nr:HesA/MoeB/ThiF family protein [Nitrospinota bacterium]
MSIHTPREGLPDEAPLASASASTARVSGKSALARSSALILGVGGLGCPAALALAASGVGRVGLADHDAVTLDNLARQILHRTEDVGRLKVDSGADSIFRLSAEAAVDKIPQKLTRENVARIIAPYDVIVDGSDNLATKLALNEACAKAGRPWVMGGVLRFFGQMMTILPGKSACLRCLVGEEGANARGLDCGDAGVIGAVAGFVGMAQAADALRVLEGLEPAWSNRLMTADLRKNAAGSVAVAQDPDCPACALAGSGQTKFPMGRGALV